MTQVVGIILAVGALLPLLISVVQQPRWSDRTRTILAVVIAALAGLVTYVTEHGLDFHDQTALVTTVVGVILASATAYKTLWKPVGLAPAIEKFTTIKGEAVVVGPAVDVPISTTANADLTLTVTKASGAESTTDPLFPLGG